MQSSLFCSICILTSQDKSKQKNEKIKHLWLRHKFRAFLSLRFVCESIRINYKTSIIEHYSIELNSCSNGFLPIEEIRFDFFIGFHWNNNNWKVLYSICISNQKWVSHVLFIWKHETSLRSFQSQIKKIKFNKNHC